jgi:hypothetical protein
MDRRVVDLDRIPHRWDLPTYGMRDEAVMAYP